VQKVAQSDADTNSHLGTVKWVVLGKLQGQTLVRFKVKRPQYLFWWRNTTSSDGWRGPFMSMMASKNFLT